MKFLSCFLSLVFSTTCVLTAADLGELQNSFITRYDALNTTRDEQLETLKGSYKGALERHLVKTKASGDLAKAIPVRDELEAVTTGTTPLPEIPETADPELKSMRGKYVAARAKVTTTHAESLVALADKMSTALESEEKDLTRNGKFDDALAAQRMRETLGKDQGITSARELLGSPAAAAPAAAAEPAEWKLLIDEKMKVEEEGDNEVGSLSDVAKEGRRFWNRMLTGSDEDNTDEILVTPSPCRVSFKTGDPITEIRGNIKLAFPGARATVRVKVDGEAIFEKEIGGRTRSLRLDEQCKSTEELEIEIEQIGDSNAWVYWTALEVR